MSFQILPFTDDLLSAAGTLLAQRCRRDRLVLPELPDRFEDPAIAAAAVQAGLDREHAAGVAALDGDRLLGYLIGDLLIDPVWGRSAWVRLAGYALAPGQGPELARDLYAALAKSWVAAGCFTHFALMPTSDPALLQAWYALSFGIEQVYGLAALPRLDLSFAPPPSGVEIRLAHNSLPQVPDLPQAPPDDRQALASMYDLIWRANVDSPVWGLHLPENDAELRLAYGDLVEDPLATVWLAFAGGEPAGFQVYFPGEPGDEALLVPEACTLLEVAGTRPQHRGRGIASALTRRGLAHAQAAGYRTCLADWRSANLLASRFWPSQGFRPVAYRLARRIDPRIAWGNGSL
jgi:ribosomal protein S18 acetylase RimI-like enzyme